MRADATLHPRPSLPTFSSSPRARMVPGALRVDFANLLLFRNTWPSAFAETRALNPHLPRLKAFAWPSSL